MDAPLDCLIVGGGPAGLTAATYLGRFRRRVTIVDKGWSRAEWISNAHNVPGFPDGIAGPALLDLMRKQASRYGAQIRHDTVTALALSADGLFTAILSDFSLKARTVLLAAGVVENKPPLSHFADAVKRGLICTCPICDGYEATSKRIAVIGSGEHAASEALFLRTYTSDVSLLLMANDPASLSDQTLDQLHAAAIPLTHVVGGSVKAGAKGFTEICVEDGATHRFDLVYTAFGTTAQSMLATGLGACVDAAGRLLVTEHQQTSIPGLYAAGDVVRGLNQISVADGEAAIAATAIHNYLPRAFAPARTGRKVRARIADASWVDFDRFGANPGTSAISVLSTGRKLNAGATTASRLVLLTAAPRPSRSIPVAPPCQSARPALKAPDDRQRDR